MPRETARKRKSDSQELTTEEIIALSEELIQIDQSSLEKEWLVQGQNYLRFSNLLAEARRLVEEAKLFLDTNRAEIDGLIRSNPGRFGIEKITEKGIEASLMGQPQVQEAEGILSRARYRVEVLVGITRAFEHRRSALENLVKLWANDYFSDPSHGSLSEEERGKVQKRAGERISGRMKNRRNV